MGYRLGLTVFPGVDLDRELQQEQEEIFQMFKDPERPPQTEEEKARYRRQIQQLMEMSRNG